ncbi:MAG: hypothetical protein CUN54_09750, partial [Phototrophicales bacterium]
FDKTGMDFLENYIGDNYTSLLASLPPRHCVAYGKALNSQSPVLIELNNRDDFQKIVPQLNIVPPTVDESTEEEHYDEYDNFAPPPGNVDDIPF